ncbi:MAG: aldehyde dehydrogenase family protein, partial [Akkermansia sp.]
MNAIVERQRAFFRTGVTLNPAYRIDCLKRLRKALLRSEGRLQDALKQDLGKCATEAYMAEIGLLLGSLREAIGSLKRWSRPRRVGCPLAQFPAKCRVVPEPYGVTLVMSPWNYPLLLALDPLIASIAAGNTCVLKPSELAPATAEATAQLLGEVFKPDHVAVVQGGPEVCTRLLEQRFDYIFFTGGTAIGKIVMKAAAEHLTPLTL